MSATDYKALKKFREWVEGFFFEFRNGGKVVVEIVDKGEFGEFGTCAACEETLKSSEVPETIYALNWRNVEDLNMKRVVSLF